uniref:Uncharacterized protein n=1 Tax=Leersia perrieri TaxID=77586 RepID=A0A0D9XKQ6_9ORYZ
MYKNQLQELAQRSCFNLPAYTCLREGPDHAPRGLQEPSPGSSPEGWSTIAFVYNRAIWTWPPAVERQEANSSNEPESNDEQEQIRIARALLNYRLKEKMAMANNPHASPFPKKFPMQPERKMAFPQSSHSSYSKILPLFRPKSNSRSRPESPAASDAVSQTPFQPTESPNPRSRFPAAEAAPYVPVGHFRMPCHSLAPPVTVRTSIPVFSAPPLPPPGARTQQLPPLMSHPPPIRMASPVRIRPAPPRFTPPATVQGPKPMMPVQMKDVQHRSPVIPVQVKDAQHQLLKGSLSPVIPVQIKDVQSQPLKESLSPAIPVQIKDVQVQPRNEPLSIGKVAIPSPVISSPVKVEAPAQVKEASQAVAKDVPCSAAVQCTADTSSDFVPKTQLKTADVDNGEAEDHLPVDAEEVEDIIRHLDLK